MIPKFLAPFLWSYDVSKLDTDRHQERIITNILNFGSQQAVDWLFETYSRPQIKKFVSNPRPGEWDKKSLNYWCLMFDVPVKHTKRLIPNT